ncbi:hypothetical protein FALBO_5615 [Fusarium albosuccineum]|uniref:Uncharacterized protein n=1 Tax=Fusarium albosuccineum TaxID=1237068 RepID=A0A8H4LFQ9_9HYPO|nr:hypothetical protein FALBO_5615 [Fusarium albosuccineum]
MTAFWPAATATSTTLRAPGGFKPMPLSTRRLTILDRPFIAASWSGVYSPMYKTWTAQLANTHTMSTSNRGRTFDVYDSGKKADGDRVPEKIPGEEAVRRFRCENEPPVNMLNNSIGKKAAEQDWLSELPGFDFVERIFEKAKELGLDLADFKRTMQVLLQGSAGADTLDHIDHNGVITKIDPWSGLKLRKMSSNRSVDGVRAFARTEKCSSNTFIILAELQWPSVTNDDHHKDLLRVLEIAMMLSEADLETERSNTWPDRNDFGRAEATLDEEKQSEGKHDETKHSAGKHEQGVFGTAIKGAATQADEIEYE